MSPTFSIDGGEWHYAWCEECLFGEPGKRAGYTPQKGFEGTPCCPERSYFTCFDNHQKVFYVGAEWFFRHFFNHEYREKS